MQILLDQVWSLYLTSFFQVLQPNTQNKGRMSLEDTFILFCLFVCLFNRSSVRNTLGSWWTRLKQKLEPG